MRRYTVILALFGALMITLSACGEKPIKYVPTHSVRHVSTNRWERQYIARYSDGHEECEWMEDMEE
jgi:hypothetical protein